RDPLVTGVQTCALPISAVAEHEDRTGCDRDRAEVHAVDRVGVRPADLPFHVIVGPRTSWAASVPTAAAKTREPAAAGAAAGSSRSEERRVGKRRVCEGV